MKPTTWFLLAAFLLGTTASALAQHTIKGKGQGDMLEKMKSELELSDQQVADWKALNETLSDQRRELMSDRDMSREDRMAAMQELRAEREAGLSDILSEEQYAKYEQMKMEAREEFSTRMQGRKAEMQQKVIEELELNDDQVTSWERLNEDYSTQQRDILTDGNLSREEKKAELQTLQNQKEADLGAILTEEQMRQYEQMKSEMKENRPKRKRLRRGRGQ